MHIKENDAKHLYFIPGMGANSRIFENIRLSQKYRCHFLEWLIPLKKESLASYAGRMAQKIAHKNPVLIGVSFGGIVAQEIAKQIPIEKVIIVSSVKQHQELPLWLKIIGKTKLLHMAPSFFLGNPYFIAKFLFGKTGTQGIEKVKKYLTQRNPAYSRWAIGQIANWQQPTPLPGIVHIHGDKDIVFPVKNLKNYICVQGGKHIMILNKHKWFNAELPVLIEK